METSHQKYLYNEDCIYINLQELHCQGDATKQCFIWILVHEYHQIPYLLVSLSKKKN